MFLLVVLLPRFLVLLCLPTPMFLWLLVVLPLSTLLLLVLCRAVGVVTSSQHAAQSAIRSAEGEEER